MNPVYKFWFGDGQYGDSDYMKKQMARWFSKDASLDAQIRTDFSEMIHSYPSPELEAWKSTPQGMVSLIILLDQFPRNAFRGTPKMFEFDPHALALAKEATESGTLADLNVFEAMFLTLPYEHSEDLEDQKESVRIFTDLHAHAGKNWRGFAAEALDYAIRHKEIIERFGRFPHRNAILGRPSTPEETEFLKQPGSGF